MSDRDKAVQLAHHYFAMLARAAGIKHHRRGQERVMTGRRRARRPAHVGVLLAMIAIATPLALVVLAVIARGLVLFLLLAAVGWAGFLAGKAHERARHQSGPAAGAYRPPAAAPRPVRPAVRPPARPMPPWPPAQAPAGINRVIRPDWLYPPEGPGRADRCCDSWTPGEGCTAGHTGRGAMGLAARELDARPPAAPDYGPLVADVTEGLAGLRFPKREARRMAQAALVAILAQGQAADTATVLRRALGDAAPDRKGTR